MLHASQPNNMVLSHTKQYSLEPIGRSHNGLVYSIALWYSISDTTAVAGSTIVQLGA